MLESGAAEGPEPHRTACAPGGSFFEAWAVLAAEGVRPAVVRAEHADDPGRPAARGITETVHPHEVPRPRRAMIQG
ncbi:hypothetical protein ACQEU8_05195 [Streptomyces sp. CA-250714]|uniref:hypothetical protein n=1 Tax=Streptomyces sp. CA-250714 TaxID=3240060 RepID=UPI003D944CD8